MTTIASRSFSKTLPDGRYVVATAELELIEGNARPYFALHGEEWKSAKHRRNGWERSGLIQAGAMGDELVAIFPELDVVNRLHLADDEGAPMHAEANGWYFYTGESHEYERNSRYHSEPTDTPHGRAARTLRADESELPEGLDREGFHEFVESLRPRWLVEAQAARAFLEATT